MGSFVLDPCVEGELWAIWEFSRFESVTLGCFNNGAKPGTGRTIDVPKFQKLVKDRGFLIDGGYGKIKGTTFRISNMGDETPVTIQTLIGAMDEAMGVL